MPWNDFHKNVTKSLLDRLSKGSAPTPSNESPNSPTIWIKLPYVGDK